MYIHTCKQNMYELIQKILLSVTRHNSFSGIHRKQKGNEKLKMDLKILYYFDKTIYVCIVF